MNEQNESQVHEATTTPEVSTHEPTPIQIACDIATGKRDADPSEEAYSIVGAKKDINCKGRGDQWYRMVYRGGSWTYVSNDRLPMGSFRASERRATVRGDVYTGEVIAQHDKGGPIDTVYLVSAAPDADDRRLIDCPFSKRRDSNLGITLPDGSLLVLPNPRK